MWQMEFKPKKCYVRRLQRLAAVLDFFLRGFKYLAPILRSIFLALFFTSPTPSPHWGNVQKCEEIKSMFRTYILGNNREQIYYK